MVDTRRNSGTSCPTDGCKRAVFGGVRCCIFCRTGAVTHTVACHEAYDVIPKGAPDA